MTGASVDLAARRLVPGTRHEELAEPRVRDFVTVHLLERGDSTELRALFSERSEEDVRAAFLARSRQLGRRDRAFWSFVLAVDPPAVPTLIEDIWPL